MTGLRLKDSWLLCLVNLSEWDHFYHFHGMWFYTYLLFMKIETDFPLSY